MLHHDYHGVEAIPSLRYRLATPEVSRPGLHGGEERVENGAARAEQQRAGPRVLQEE